MESMTSAEVLRLKSDLIEGISSYMKYGGAEDENDPNYDPKFDAGYTQEHVDSCDEILNEFLSSLSKVEGVEKRESIMGVVKIAVLALNDLNAQCDGSMIETDQREQLCELIITAANDAGLNTEDDITEEWREW